MAEVAELQGPWVHESGLHLPRGCLVTRQATEAELQALAARSAARRAAAPAAARLAPPRPAGDTAQLDGFCEWLQAEGLDVFGSVTYRDDYAERFSIFSLNRALGDVWRGLHDFGFRYKFVLAGEWHPSGRRVPHVHLAMESGGIPADRVCRDLYGYFLHSRGRCRFEPMRDQSVATLYALKDSVKASARDADSIRFRLWRPKRVRLS